MTVPPQEHSTALLCLQWFFVIAASARGLCASHGAEHASKSIGILGACYFSDPIRGRVSYGQNSLFLDRVGIEGLLGCIYIYIHTYI